MCRALAYLGTPVVLSDMLHSPDSSLVRQAYDPRHMQTLNLAGFGFVAWDPDSHDADRPFAYRTTALPMFDANLLAIASKIRSNAFIAHVRGVAYSAEVIVGPQNLHPFSFEGCSLVMAHNGDIARMGDMRKPLLERIKPEFARQIRGTTDSEWMYALLASQLQHPRAFQTPEQITAAVGETLRILRQIRAELGIRLSSSANFFISDGRSLVVTRFTFDFGHWNPAPPPAGPDFLGLWFTVGKDYGFHDGEWKMVGGVADPDSLIVASEPLSSDVSTWLEVPEYSMLCASREGSKIRVRTIPLEI